MVSYGRGSSVTGDRGHGPGGHRYVVTHDRIREASGRRTPATPSTNPRPSVSGAATLIVLVRGVVATMTDDDGGGDRDGDPDVPVHCPECGTASRVPLSDAAAPLKRHNERLCGGADVARVDPEVADRLTDAVAEELGLL